MSECCYKVWQWKNNSCQTKRALQSASCSFSPAGLCQNECGILNWTIHHISRVFQLMTLQSDRWRVIRKELCISIPINSLSNSSAKTWPEREKKRKFHPPSKIFFFFWGGGRMFKPLCTSLAPTFLSHPRSWALKAKEKITQALLFKGRTVSLPDRYFLFCC